MTDVYVYDFDQINDDTDILNDCTNNLPVNLCGLDQNGEFHHAHDIAADSRWYAMDGEQWEGVKRQLDETGRPYAYLAEPLILGRDDARIDELTAAGL